MELFNFVYFSVFITSKMPALLRYAMTEKTTQRGRRVTLLCFGEGRREEYKQQRKEN